MFSQNVRYQKTYPAITNKSSSKLNPSENTRPKLQQCTLLIKNQHSSTVTFRPLTFSAEKLQDLRRKRFRRHFWWISKNISASQIHACLSYFSTPHYKVSFYQARKDIDSITKEPSMSPLSGVDKGNIAEHTEHTYNVVFGTCRLWKAGTSFKLSRCWSIYWVPKRMEKVNKMLRVGGELFCGKAERMKFASGNWILWANGIWNWVLWIMF